MRPEVSGWFSDSTPSSPCHTADPRSPFTKRLKNFFHPRVRWSPSPASARHDHTSLSVVGLEPSERSSSPPTQLSSLGGNHSSLPSDNVHSRPSSRILLQRTAAHGTAGVSKSASSPPGNMAPASDGSSVVFIGNSPPHYRTGWRGHYYRDTTVAATKEHTKQRTACKTERDMCDNFEEQGKPKQTYFRRTWEGGKGWAMSNCHPVRFFPIYTTLRNYKLSFISVDLVTGLSEGIMAVPQGMSYSILANLDPIYGLYCSLIFPLMYLIFGTSVHCSFGVSAIEAVLVAETVNSTVGEEAPDEFRVEATFLLTVLMGLVFLAMRLASLGLIADFLADPVLSGFSTASALVIGSKQLKDLFGIEEITSNWMVVQWWQLVTNIHRTNWFALLIGVSGIIVLILVKYINRRFAIFRHVPIPGPLVIIILSTLLAWGAGLSYEPYDVHVVGDIPGGLPGFHFPFSVSYPERTDDQPYEYTLGPLALQLLPRALVLCFIYFVIHISVTKTLAKKVGKRLDNDQELVAMGFANVVGSLFMCFPNATSLSRSTVNCSIGVKTVLHNLPYAVLILFVLLFLTSALYFLPMSTLAAIVLVGVYNIMDFKVVPRLWRLGGLDLWIWFVAFGLTCLFGAMAGVIVSVALSVVWLLHKSARPTAAILGHLPGTTVYRNVKRFPMAREFDHIKILRFDASLNFSNSDYFEEKLKDLVNPAPNTKGSKRSTKGGEGEELPPLPVLKILVVDASSINDLDATAIAMLDRVYRFFNEHEVRILFANWKGPMREFLERGEFYTIIPRVHCFLSLHDAVVHARRMLVEVGGSFGGGSADSERATEFDSNMGETRTQTVPVGGDGVPGEGGGSTTAHVMEEGVSEALLVSPGGRAGGRGGEYITGRGGEGDLELEEMNTRSHTYSGEADRGEEVEGGVRPSGRVGETGGGIHSLDPMAVGEGETSVSQSPRVNNNTPTAQTASARNQLTPSPSRPTRSHPMASNEVPVMYSEIVLGHERQWIVYQEASRHSDH